MEVSINEDLLIVMLLYSLPASFENFRCTIESRDLLLNAETLNVKILEENDARKQASSLEVQGAMVVTRKGKKFTRQNNSAKQSNKNNQRIPRKIIDEISHVAKY
ncbi:hypothetical protein ACFW04_006551 [Cataglyphis niger]